MRGAIAPAWLLLLLTASALASTAMAQTLPGMGAVEPQEQPTEPLPIATPPDERIKERLQGVFDRVAAFDDIIVEVDEGVVFLRGTVERNEARERAERFAQRLDGVLFVANEIQVQRDVEGRLTPAMTRLQEFLDTLVAQLPLLALALGLVAVFYLSAKLITLSDAPFRLLGINPLLSSLLRRLIFIIIVIVGVFIAIDILDITALVGASIGAAGVAGLAIGFAFRDVAENYLAGVLLSVRRPFAIGDLVTVDEHEGKVVRLTPRELVLMTLDGNHVRIPNGVVFRAVIHNFTVNPRRQFSFDVGVGNDADLVAVQQLGVATLLGVEGVLREPPPLARVWLLGESNVTVRFFAWVDQRQHGFIRVRSDALRLVKQAFDQADVSMPAPKYEISLHRTPPPSPAPPTPTPTEVSPPVSASSAGPPRGKDEEAVVTDQIREDLAHSDEENLLERKRTSGS